MQLNATVRTDTNIQTSRHKSGELVYHWPHPASSRFIHTDSQYGDSVKWLRHRGCVRAYVPFWISHKLQNSFGSYDAFLARTLMTFNDFFNDFSPLKFKHADYRPTSNVTSPANFRFSFFSSNADRDCRQPDDDSWRWLQNVLSKSVVRVERTEWFCAVRRRRWWNSCHQPQRLSAAVCLFLSASPPSQTLLVNPAHRRKHQPPSCDEVIVLLFHTSSSSSSSKNYCAYVFCITNAEL